MDQLIYQEFTPLYLILILYRIPYLISFLLIPSFAILNDSIDHQGK